MQRVARGLVECLDEVPQVVLHLQRTADRCRENAALAIVASQGRATVAAQQLDAAARACEAAAHYLSMAPPKAKAWAERLVGEGRSSNRPDSGSADRNKATGGVGERDSRGRTRWLEARFKPGEDPEAGEAPLIRVARKAFEELRKQQEKDAEEWDRSESPEELEVELVVDPKGELRVAGKAAASADEDEDAERQEPAYEIVVDLGDAARELLEAMAASGEQVWERAELVIAVDRVTATFEYGEDGPEVVVPVVDVELPEFEVGEVPGAVDVPVLDVEVGETEFDPAFEPRALGVDFAPGVHDPGGSFKPHEIPTAERLAENGWRVDARPPDHKTQRHKNPDVMLRKSGQDPGVRVEIKAPISSKLSAIKRNIRDASKQAKEGGEVVIDGRTIDLSEFDMHEAFRSACLQEGSPVSRRVHFILGDGRLVTLLKEMHVRQ
nr:hypothetical protein [Kribbella italica]